MVASVSSSTLATETAFSNAVRTTLAGSTMPASIRSTYSLRAASKPKVALARQHARNDHAPIYSGILRDLSRGRFEGTLQDLNAGLLVTLAGSFFPSDRFDRPETTLESLSKLKPAFRKDGTITAGNAPGLNSGAAAMVVADRTWAEKKGLQPMARLAAYGIGAVEPGMFGLGPVPAVKQALDRAGWKIGDIGRIEINEAFAAIVLAVTKDLGLSPDVVNVEGGAIAHGHPIGASGAVLTTRLLHSMQRDGIKKGVVTLCIGGGQGIALALEAVT